MYVSFGTDANLSLLEDLFVISMFNSHQTIVIATTSDLPMMQFPLCNAASDAGWCKKFVNNDVIQR